jgi:isoleucyl-tRNA synthetase
VLARAFKDIFPRYKTMQGYYVQRRGGWDTHGLPVEIEVEKRLGSQRQEADREVRHRRIQPLCRASTMEYIAEWERLTERMAFWVDLKTAYVTFHNEYVESLWWIMKQFWDKGLLFQGYKIVPYCPRCGTPLSSHELSLGYKEGTIDPSVYVKFRVKDGEGRGFDVAQPNGRGATMSTCWPGRPRRGRCRATWRWPWARTWTTCACAT